MCYEIKLGVPISDCYPYLFSLPTRCSHEEKPHLQLLPYYMLSRSVPLPCPGLKWKKSWVSVKKKKKSLLLVPFISTKQLHFCYYIIKFPLKDNEEWRCLKKRTVLIPLLSILSSPVLTSFLKIGKGDGNGKTFPFTWNCSPGILSLLPPLLTLGRLPRTCEGNLMPLKFYILTRNRVVQGLYNLVQAAGTSP